MTFNDPWSQTSYRKSRSPRKPATKKAKKAKKPVQAPKKTDEHFSGAGGGACLRSPCGVRDPEVDWIMFDHEVKRLRSGDRGRKDKAPWPTDGGYMVLAFGGGVDSSAMLVGLDQLWRDTGDVRWVPRAVAFADVGSEVPQTYSWCDKVDKWLRTKAFKGAPKGLKPEGLTKVCGGTVQGARSWGSSYTLEQQSLINHAMPGISFSNSNHTCSTLWKIEAQRAWFEPLLGTDKFPFPRGKREILKAIGYDATEGKRKEKGSTYTAKDEEKHGYKAWFPLIDWGWGRARCMAEIFLEFGSVPRKSSCYFCGAMKAKEVVMLAEDHPDLLERAIFMEQVAIMGRHKPRKRTQGLSQGLRWTDVALGDLKAPGLSGSPLWQAHLIGGVVRTHPSKQTAPRKLLGSHGVWDKRSKRYVAYVPLGGRDPIPLADNEHYVPPAKIPGLPPGQLMSRKRVNALVAQAKEWIAASPKKGQQGVVDMALSPLLKKIPAFNNVLGYRSKKHGLTYDGLSVRGQELLDSGDEFTAGKLERLVYMARHPRRGQRRNPRRLPIARSPFESGVGV